MTDALTVPDPTMSENIVYAAGGVLWRLVEGKLRILLIHRTQGTPRCRAGSCTPTA